MLSPSRSSSVARTSSSASLSSARSSPTTFFFHRGPRRAAGSRCSTLTPSRAHSFALQRRRDLARRLGEVADVAHGGGHPVAGGEEGPDRLRLGRRFDDDQVCRFLARHWLLGVNSMARRGRPARSADSRSPRTTSCGGRPVVETASRPRVQRLPHPHQAAGDLCGGSGDVQQRGLAPAAATRRSASSGVTCSQTGQLPGPAGAPPGRWRSTRHPEREHEPLPPDHPRVASASSGERPASPSSAKISGDGRPACGDLRSRSMNSSPGGGRESGQRCSSPPP
jgi:hypothetical protein